MFNSVVFLDIHAARLIINSSTLASGAPQPERKTPIQICVNGPLQPKLVPWAAVL